MEFEFSPARCRDANGMGAAGVSQSAPAVSYPEGAQNEGRGDASYASDVWLASAFVLMVGAVVLCVIGKLLGVE